MYTISLWNMLSICTYVYATEWIQIGRKKIGQQINKWNEYYLYQIPIWKTKSETDLADPL